MNPTDVINSLLISVLYMIIISAIGMAVAEVIAYIAKGLKLEVSGRSKTVISVVILFYPVYAWSAGFFGMVFGEPSYGIVGARFVDAFITSFFAGRGSGYVYDVVATAVVWLKKIKHTFNNELNTIRSSREGGDNDGSPA